MCQYRARALRNLYYSRNTAICIYSVSQLKRKNQFVKISLWTEVIGIANIFAGRTTFEFCPNMAIA
jgi:hypothetical protein